MIDPAHASPATLAWWNRLGPWARADTSHYLLTWLESLGYQHQLTENYVRDTPTIKGWAVLLDADHCPTVALPWLAQFAGTPIPVGTSDANARTLIKAGGNQKRGGLDAITAAIQPYLTGTQRVRIQERTAANGTADAYRFRVTTYTPETTGGAGGATATAIRGVLNAVTPGGLQYSYFVDSGPEINQLVGLISAQPEVHISDYANEIPG